MNKYENWKTENSADLVPVLRYRKRIGSMLLGGMVKEFDIFKATPNGTGPKLVKAGVFTVHSSPGKVGDIYRLTDFGRRWLDLDAQ